MVRKFLYICLLSIFLFANEDKDIYESNCVKCHDKLPVSIDKFFYKYLLKYSSEKDVKKAMMDYMKNPIDENSIMGDSFINRFGIKKKSKLNDNDLKEALDTYWEKYKIIGKLK